MLKANQQIRLSKKSKVADRKIIPYNSESEFLGELQTVMEQDYGSNLRGAALKQAGANINEFLRVFLPSI